GLSSWGYQQLNASARREAEYWKYAAKHWESLSPELVDAPNERWQFRYTGDEPVNCQVPFLEHKPSLTEFQALLQKNTQQPLPNVWLFKPLSWLKVRAERDRQPAQQVLFGQWILKP